jgi:acetyl-CoA acyltransferase 2
MSVIENLVFVAAKRTAFGAFGGSLKDLTATDLGVFAAKACLDQSGLQASDLDSVVIGNVCQSDKDSIYVARHIGLRIGMPQDRPALIVNRLCGSGFEAIAQGAYQIFSEGASAVLVGGVESMTRMPYVLRGARFGYRMGNSEIEDSLMASLTDSFVGLPMALTAENLAVQYSLSRTQVDEIALRSQERAKKAWDGGIYNDEITPVVLKSKKGDVTFARDEHLRPETTLETLAKLKPVFKSDGVVTAGNASGIVDGAACLILTTESFAKKKGLAVLGRLICWAAVGCDPKVMGIGPVPATRKALERYSSLSGATKTISSFKRVEINEAFAPQYLAVEKELGLNPELTNVHGGAISVGHPLAASGARLVSHLLYDLKRSGGGAGLASACIGGGQGMSMIVEV